MRDLALRVPVLLRWPLGAFAGLALCVPVALLTPDGWPFWAYVLSGVPSGLLGSIVGQLWHEMGEEPHA
jgi:hypothetical protein